MRGEWVSDRRSPSAVGSRASWPATWPFRRVLGIRPVGHRTAAAVLALGTVLLGLRLAAGVQLVGLVAVLVTTLVAEARWQRAAAAAPPSTTRSPP